MAKRLNSCQARWALFFNHLNFPLSYRPGSENSKPVALSRQFQPAISTIDTEGILPVTCLICAISWEIEDKVKQSHTECPCPSACPYNRLYVPATLRSQVFQWGHSSRLACHPGVRCTLALLRQRFWWPSMEEDTGEFTQAPFGLL